MIDFIPAPEAGEGVVKCVNPVLGVEVLHDTNPARWGERAGFGCWLVYRRDCLVKPSIELNRCDGGFFWRSGELKFEDPDPEVDFFACVFAEHGAKTAQEKVAAVESWSAQVRKDLEWAMQVKVWLDEVLSQIGPVQD